MCLSNEWLQNQKIQIKYTVHYRDHKEVEQFNCIDSETWKTGACCEIGKCKW